MFPSLQPSRPKPPQQTVVPTYAHQQRRAGHDVSQVQHTVAPQYPPSNWRPQSQVEAMPPFASKPARTPFFPPQAIYDSAKCHPVFFTTNLKKPPFPIPQMASQGWSPVASGYIMEQRKPAGPGTEPRAKL